MFSRQPNPELASEIHRAYRALPAERRASFQHEFSGLLADDTDSDHEMDSIVLHGTGRHMRLASYPHEDWLEAYMHPAHAGLLLFRVGSTEFTEAWARDQLN
ncbi:hypothetical protein [Deinococcus koreensis]|uniref:Uncharacterized protein n=1 Tax=Deinococcus koreensis TaxID=2054903 RepID=A0A2K3V1S6_9DEIO|nr:hypothetical protein [Deinococcus koreensis]PNY82740.1 hypothetical protein CVO96_16510 [Deinococcus koreensis]